MIHKLIAFIFEKKHRLTELDIAIKNELEKSENTRQEVIKATQMLRDKIEHPIARLNGHSPGRAHLD
jgi:hypothetical protein